MFKILLLTATNLLTSATFAQTSTSPFPATETYVLHVNRMMCGSCTSRVKKVIQSQPGTSNVTVNLTDQEARFSCPKDKGCDVEKITKNLSKIGYPAKVDQSSKQTNLKE